MGNESDNPGIPIINGPGLAALYRAATRVDAGKSTKLSFTVDGGVDTTRLSHGVSCILPHELDQLVGADRCKGESDPFRPGRGSLFTAVSWAFS